MVRKDVIEIAKKLYQNGAKITLVTNGYLLDKKIDICKYLKRINLSIHTLNRESYEKIVCVKNTYNKVIENIKNVSTSCPFGNVTAFFRVSSITPVLKTFFLFLECGIATPSEITTYSLCLLAISSISSI